MAKSSRSAPSRTVVRTVTPPPVRVSLAPMARRAGRAAGRAARAVGSSAREEQHRLYAVAAAGLLGVAKRQGWPLPSIGPLGTSGSAAIIAYAIHKLTKSRTASHAATGLACVAAYSLGREHEVAGGGDATVFDD